MGWSKTYEFNDADLNCGLNTIDQKLLDSSSQPAWMRSLQASCESWLASLPEKLDFLPRTPTSAANPLFRVFDRENSIGHKLLKTVPDDLKNPSYKLVLVKMLLMTMPLSFRTSNWKEPILITPITAA